MLMGHPQGKGQGGFFQKDADGTPRLTTMGQCL
jgi:hypothetical protein